MNGHKSKALRRAAKQIAAQFPDVHSKVTYQDIVRKTIKQVTVRNKETILGRLGHFFTRKKAPPKTKEKEIITKISVQTVLASGWKFILRRLKTRVRQGAIRILPNGKLVEVPHPLGGSW